MTIGENIRRLRKEKGYTQRQLAEQCDMYESQIRKYESGSANPKLETIQRIAKALNVPLLVLLDQISQDLSDELIKENETEKSSFVDISLLREIFGKIDLKKEKGHCYYILNNGGTPIIISDLTFTNILESLENLIRLYVKIASEHPESQECLSLMYAIKDMNLQQIQSLLDYAEFLKQKHK